MTKQAENLTFSVSQSGVVFWIHVTPRARRPGVGGSRDGALRVAVREPPAEGKANAACAKALAEALEIPRSAVELERGSRARRKRVRIAGDAEAVTRRLRALAEVEVRH